MKTIREVLNFCYEFTFYDQNSVERVIELKHVLDCITNVLFEDFINEDHCIRVLGLIDDISLIIKKDIENIGREINKVRAGVLQLLCLEKLYKEDANNENREVYTINGKKNNIQNKIESLQNKKWFPLIYVGVLSN